MELSERQTTLARMRAGQTGKVAWIAGGLGPVRRLHALGIRPGKRVKKVSSVFWRGPVTVQVDGSQLALGFGIANRIVIELD